MICISLTLSGQQIYTVDTDRANASYQVGETIRFQINSMISGTASYEIILDKHSPALAAGTITLQAGQITELPFTATAAAVVMCKVKKDGVTQMAAAAISPFELSPVEDEPDRFDEFWEEAHASLANIPIDAKVTLYRESEYATTYRVNIASIDNRRVYGYISVPKKEGPYPGVLTLPAYGRIANVVTPAIYLAEQAGALSLAISIHNVEPDMVDPKAYKPNSIMNEYTNYYRYAVLACLRGIDYLFSRSDFNGELAVTGVSQGGGLALMTAGLDKRVDLLVYSNASHCEHTGKKYDTASGFPYYLNQARLMYNIDASDEADIVEACKYYDAIYFAQRYEGPSLGFISYQDEVSPPTTTFKAFNALNGQKVLMHGKTLKHEHPQEYWVGRYDALRRFMPGTQDAPWPYARKTRGYLLNIGEDQIIEEGNSIEFTPTLIQHEETINLAATWHQLEGPADVTFSDATSLVTTASFSMPGTYKLQVRVQDESLLEPKAKFYSIADEVTIFVHDGNLPLLIECPEDITLFTSTDTAIATWSFPAIQSTCDGAQPTMMQTAGLGIGSAFPTGRTRVAYRIEDACGNQTTCSFYVTILKETFTPLEISCPENITIYTDSESAIANWDRPVITSACNANPTTYTQIEGLSSGSVFSLGDTQISYQITDACGQTTTCSFIVTIIQELDPLIVACPPDTVLYTLLEELVVDWHLPTITSACNEETVTYTQIEGVERNTAFPLGETVVRYEITDACGQLTSCDFTVTLIQFDPLVINCPPDITFDTMEDSLVVNWILPTVTSACNTAAVSYTQIEGVERNTAFPIGETTVSYEVTDACGQIATCSFIVTVIQELTPLVISCPTDSTLYTMEDSLIVNWELPSVVSACRDGVVEYTQIEGVARNVALPIGVTQISYEARDACGQTTICSFIVTIIQELNPLIISCPADSTLYTMEDSLVVNWELPSVVSACRDGVVEYTQIEGVARNVALPIGTTEISYEARDACGQTTICSFTITVIQAFNPLFINCPENIIMYTDSTSLPINWELPSVVSACRDGAVEYTQIEGTTRNELFSLGATQISYEANDACGQLTTCSFTVTLIQNIEPIVIACPNDTTITTYNDNIIPTWNLPNVLSACAADNIQYAQTIGPTFGNPFSLGKTLITYEVVDSCGQEASCSFIIDVVQIEQPPLQIECPSAITLYTLTGSALPNWELPEVASSCGEGLQFRQIEGLPLGSVFRLGLTQISYEVMDGCGQIDTCSFLVEVIDENPPNLSIVCPFNVHLTINAPDTILTWELPEIVSACNEEELTYTQVVGPPQGGVFEPGTTRITYKVEDSCGQIKYCSFNVTIFQNMNMPLVVDCPTNINRRLPFGSNSSQIHWSIPQVVSFCSDELTISQIQGPSSGSLFQEGTSTVMYIIQDGCGNRELCTFDVELTARTEREPDVDTFGAENKIQAYPNPTEGLLFLHWQSNDSAKLQLEVVNLLGQILYQEEVHSVVGENTRTLELHDLPAGCYILQVRDSETWISRASFIKQ